VNGGTVVDRDRRLVEQFRHGKESRRHTDGMVSAVAVAGLVVIVLVNSAVTALMTRFFRVRLHTRWGGLLYSLLLCPLALLILGVVLSVPIGPFIDLGTITFLALVVVLPLTLGMTFDYVWMPSPDDVELPTST